MYHRRVKGMEEFHPDSTVQRKCTSRRKPFLETSESVITCFSPQSSDMPYIPSSVRFCMRKISMRTSTVGCMIERTCPTHSGRLIS